MFETEIFATIDLDSFHVAITTTSWFPDKWQSSTVCTANIAMTILFRDIKPLKQVGFLTNGIVLCHQSNDNFMYGCQATELFWEW